MTYEIATEAPEGADTEPTTDQPSKDASSGNLPEHTPSFWQRLFGTRESEDGERGREQDTQQESPAAKPWSQMSADEKRTLIATDPEGARILQSEADKRHATWLRQQRDQQQAEEERRLRDEDPFAYADKKRQEEDDQQATGTVFGFIHQVSQSFDAEVVSPVVRAVPESMRADVIKAASAPGLAGRRAAVEKSLELLQKHWKAEGRAEAERDLRKNGTFRKQLLVEARGEQEEPEVVPAAPSRRQETMNDWIRSL